jgi:AraC-like DNA-binding protein
LQLIPGATMVRSERGRSSRGVRHQTGADILGMHPAIVAASLHTDERIRFALEMMMSPTHLRSRVNTIASMLGLSPSRLRHLFKEQMGISIHKYEVILRLERVRILLRTTRCDVKDAARSVGFNDLSNFTNTFKKVYGITPGMLKVDRSPVRSSDF